MSSGSLRKQQAGAEVAMGARKTEMGFSGNRLDAVQGFWAGRPWLRAKQACQQQVNSYGSADRLGVSAVDSCKEAKSSLGDGSQQVGNTCSFQLQNARYEFQPGFPRQ